MNTPAPPHSEEHESLLHDHLAGDLPEGDGGLRRLLESCSTCRTRLEELRSMTDLLGRVGREQRRALIDLPAFAEAPGTDLVAPTLRALAAGQPLPRPTPQPRLAPVPAAPRATLWRVSLAAASVLAAGWLVKALLPVERPEREDTLLGDQTTQTLAPHGTVPTFERFSWAGLGTQIVRYELRIWGADQAALDDPLLELALYSDHWEPTDQQARDLPREIYWEVTGYDQLGQASAFAVERATRREP